MNKISIHQLKHDRARSYLRNKLLFLPQGEALPGMRTMIAESGIGRRVLEQTLLEAEKDGLLVRKARSGFYRSESCSGEKPDLLIYVENSGGKLDPVGSSGIPSAIARNILFLQDLARQHGMKSALYTSFEELPQLPLPLFAVSITSPEIIERIDRNWPRAVTISGLPGRLWVRPPYERATWAGLEHLAALGHKAVGYTYYKNHSPLGRDRHLFEYYRFMAEHGFKTEPAYVIPYPDGESVAEGIRKMFSCPRPPTAVFASSCWLPTVYRVLEELRINVPWEVSVLGLGNMEFIENLHPFPAFVNESSALMAQEAWRLMFDSDAETAQVTPPLEIFPGNSLRRCR